MNGCSTSNTLIDPCKVTEARDSITHPVYCPHKHRTEGYSPCDGCFVHENALIKSIVSNNKETLANGIASGTFKVIDICKMNTSPHVYQVPASKEIFNVNGRDLFKVDKDTPLGVISGSTFMKNIDVGQLPTRVEVFISSGYWASWDAGQAPFPPTVFNPQYTIDGGKTWIDFRSGGADRVARLKDEANSLENNFEDSHLDEKLVSGDIEFGTQILLTKNSLTGISKVTGNAMLSTAKWLETRIIPDNFFSGQ